MKICIHLNFNNPFYLYTFKIICNLKENKIYNCTQNLFLNPKHIAYILNNARQKIPYHDAPIIHLNLNKISENLLINMHFD